jgi:cysteine-rich repeat protein
MAAVCATAWVACTSGDESVGAVTVASAPPGSNAALVSDTIPTTMHPGERLIVQVVMQNTGASDPANTWTTSSPIYSLVRLTTPNFGWDRRDVNVAVPVGSNHTFTFVLTAPTTPGPYTFSVRMSALGQGFFGPTITRTITVDPDKPRAWHCTYLPGSSSIPSTVAPGENRVFTVAVQNTGTESWPASGFSLYSRDTPLGLWNNTMRSLTTAVAPGGTAVFSVPVTAPSTPGSYSFRRQIHDARAGGLGFFDLVNNCVDVAITVGGSPQLDAQVVSTTLPSTMAPGEVRTVSVTMRNTGTLSWPADGTVYLYSANSPANLYSRLVVYPTASTAVGDDRTFTFSITAPTTPGTYNQAWRMRTDAGFFGEVTAVPLVVDPMASPALNASVVSQSIPLLVTAGRITSFSVTMENTGTETWSGSSYMLYSRNASPYLWGTLNVPLGGSETVAPGASRVFTFNVSAPTTPGTYESRWQMFKNGTAFFGQQAITSNVVVTLCGNGTLDAGEACDDNNLVNGDGCSNACQYEVEEFDLLTDSVDRTIEAPGSNRQLATVRIGDVTGDSTPEIVVSDSSGYTPPSGPGRNTVGIVYGYTGGAAFFNGATTSVPTGAAFRVIGASPFDRLGVIGTGGVVLADVTGDGTQDLVVSAAFADGPSEGRTDSGEVYVIQGGSGLSGDIDLGATPAPSAWIAHILGASAGDQLIVLAAGDLTGDGTADLVLGAPFADTANGTDSGAVYIVPGGASLTGTIDLSTATSVVRILGPAADSRLGSFAAVGQLVGSAAPDLFLGHRGYTASGRIRTGAVWGFVGPVTTDRDLAAAVGTPSGASLAWIGETQNDNFGLTLAIGNVVGTSANDIVIGSIQHRRSGTQVGAVLVWNGASVTVGSTYDLGLGATPTAMFRGAEANDNTGSSVALGDMNGDGRLDIAFGSGLADGPGNTRSSAGEAAVYFGAATLPALTDLTSVPGRVRIIGAASSDATAAHTSGIAMGDINGDGRADLCVGSFQGGAARGGRVDCIASMF